MVKRDIDPDQRHPCDVPGCNKSYSRPDHLLRHKLNHNVNRLLSCNQCDRTFVRQDLLARHLERHALRGKTLGRWSNKIKEKENHDDSMPKHHHHPLDPSTSKRRSKLANMADPTPTSSSTLSHELARPSAPFSTASDPDPRSTWNSLPPSQLKPTADPTFKPPTAFPSSLAHGTDTWSPPPTSCRNPNQPLLASHAAYPPTDTYHQFSAFGPNSNLWNPAQQASNSSEPPLRRQLDSSPAHHSNPDALSNPTHPSSVRWISSDDHGAEISRASYAPPSPDEHGSAWPEPCAISSSNQSGSFPATVPSPALGLDPVKSSVLTSQLTAQSHDIFPFAPLPSIDNTADYGWLFDGVDPFSSAAAISNVGTNPQGGPLQSSAFSPSSSDGFLGGFPNGAHNPNGNTAEAPSFGRGLSSDRVLLPNSDLDSPNALQDLAYFASLQAEIPSKVTYHVDHVAHHRLLVFLQSVSELPTSPLFTPSALRCYLYLFFVKFNRLYPLIHEPTFAASTTDPMLLSAMVVIGAHFAGLPAHELAVRIAQKIWGAIVSLQDFRPARATLPMLQAMVLTECFGKMMSTRAQHEMAHLFHNFTITLARRNAVFNPSAANIPSTYQQSEEHWRSWAREEEKKRIALFVFMLDAQHATTFRHIPALSAFQIQLNLPCSDDEWDKPTPQQWYAHRRKPNYHPPSPFISALKACLHPGKTSQQLDAFPRFVLLHGLMSIAYDLQSKQNILLGTESSPGGSKDRGIANWKDKLCAAYSVLQTTMDTAYIRADQQDSSASIIHRATPSLVSAAQITLFADTIDIQIYAGLPSVLGRFIDRATFNTSRRLVKEWARTSDGRTAVWHAVNFLRTSMLGAAAEPHGSIHAWRSNHDESLDKGADLDTRSGITESKKNNADRATGIDEVLHHRWCQYLCALVIWAYGHALAPSRTPHVDTLVGVGPPSVHSSSHHGLPENAQPNRQHRHTYSFYADGTLKPEGVEFLERMSTNTPNEIADIGCKFYTRGVLEMVELEVRGSRWELGREASGVLGKLISNHSMPYWDRLGVDATPRSAHYDSYGKDDNDFYRRNPPPSHQSAATNLTTLYHSHSNDTEEGPRPKRCSEDTESSAIYVSHPKLKESIQTNGQRPSPRTDLASHESGLHLDQMMMHPTRSPPPFIETELPSIKAQSASRSGSADPSSSSSFTSNDVVGRPALVT